MRGYHSFVLIAAIALANSASADITESAFRAVLRNHCVDCHGPETQENDLRLDTLPLKNLNANQVKIWQTAFKLVSAGEMPPDDDPELTTHDAASITKFLSTLVSRESVRLSPDEVVLRRLNKEQYRNSLRDLLGIDVTVENPAAGLPPDEVASGFDNIGSALTLSPLHVQAYLEAAEQAVSQWEAQADAKPNSFRFKIPSEPDEKQIRFNQTLQTDDYIDLFNSAWTNRRFKTMVFPANKQVNKLWPHAGRYRITVDVEAINTDNRAGYDLIGQLKLDHEPDPAHTPQFGFFLRRPSRSITPNIDRRVATFEIPHGQRKTMSTEAWLPGGLYTLAINFDTGPRFELGQAAARLFADREGILEKPNKKSFSNSEDYATAIAEYDKLKSSRDEFVKTFRKSKDLELKQSVFDFAASSPLPRLRFHSVIVEGPLPDSTAPTKEFFQQVQQDEQFLHQSLRRFVSHAFRRPVSEDELAPYIAYAKATDYRSTVKALLCSPNFIYLREKPGALQPFALASRLSYFLWNSKPDNTLLRQAASGTLATRKTLQAEVNRMLADEKSASFVSRFLHQWLALANIKDMPAAKSHVYYHDLFIDELMVEETNRFVRQMITSNAPVADIFHADYTFMNSALAKHYGRSDVTGADFQRVSLKSDSNRRGLLGQGAILTTSANGIDTSPVVRGIWVLDKLLGTPPSPPPDDVEVIEPDTRGTKTLREMYAAHRTDASCSRCHKKIDPLGFALENFDPIGRWRDEYDGGTNIESYGKLPNGERFDDIRGLRQLLKDDKVDLLARNLLTRLMICATGRKLSVADDAEIEELLIKHKATGYRLRDLIQAVVSSDTFLNK